MILKADDGCYKNLLFFILFFNCLKLFVNTSVSKISLQLLNCLLPKRTQKLLHSVKLDRVEAKSNYQPVLSVNQKFKMAATTNTLCVVFRRTELNFGVVVAENTQMTQVELI